MKKYYNNGINEKRLSENETIPFGYKKGRLKSPITTQGKMFINNGIKECFINKNDPIPDGFIKGRLKTNLNPQKQRETLKAQNRHYYNNGTIEISLKENDEIPEGFIKGRLPMSNNQKKKLSDSHIGKHHTKESKKKISEHSNNNRCKAFNTIKTKYGSFANFYNIIHIKGNETKSKNKTFNTSNIEKNLFEYLKKEFPNKLIFTHFKDKERYPYYCDFYIKEDDLFIELNAHWTHGGKPYNAEDKECQEQLKLWEEKAKTSEFYRNAIYTWTVRDVNKINCAKQNNLNYLVIY